MTLGEYVKQYRKQHKISMDNFAEKSGLSKGYISMLEKNENPRSKKAITPSLETIRQVAAAINIDLNTLIASLDTNQEMFLDTMYANNINDISQESEHINKEDTQNVNAIRKNSSNNFYEILQEIMNEKSLTIPETARMTGLADSTIRSIINRKTKTISLEVAFKISKGLYVSLERLNGEKLHQQSLTNEHKDSTQLIEQKYIEMAKELEKHSITHKDIKKMIKIFDIIKQE